MSLEHFPQHYTFIGLANVGGDELVYKLFDTITNQEVFCTIVTFDQAHKKEYIELLSAVQIYSTLDHRGLLCYKTIEAEPEDLRFFFMTGPYNLNLSGLNLLINTGGKSYCETALWQVAAQLIDIIAYYNLPRTRQFGHKSTLLATPSFPHCILRPSSIVITNPFAQESDLIQLVTRKKHISLSPLLIKVIPGILTPGQLHQFQFAAIRFTLSYIAPEIRLDLDKPDASILFQNPSEAVDVWSIGSILYEMATGKVYDYANDPSVANASAYSFEFQSMLKSMLSIKPSDRPTLGDLLRIERIHTMLAETQTGHQKLLSDQSRGVSFQPVELQARQLLAKLPYSTAEQAQIVADWQHELPHEPNYLLGVMNMIDGCYDRHLTPTGNRFVHTNSNLTQSIHPKIPQTPASIFINKNTRYGRKMAKSPTAVQDTYTQLMQHALKNSLVKAKKVMDQVCIAFIDGTSALMIAAEHNSIDVAQLLVSYECCLQSKNGLTALMYAAKKGHTDMVSLLLNHESMMIDSNGYTALMHAITQGHIGCIQLLVKVEANYSTLDGITAGILATKDINNIMKQFTSQVTPQITPVTIQRTPDTKKVSNTKRSVTPSINQNIATNDERHSIINKLTIAQIVTAYEDTCDPTTYLTCLMIAVRYHSTELMKMFMHQAGCQTPKGLTALHLAVQELFVDGVILLAPREMRYTTLYSINGFSFYRATALCLAALIGGCSDNKAISQGIFRNNSNSGSSQQGDRVISSQNYFRSVSQYSFGNALSARATTRSSRDNERAIFLILNTLVPLEATYKEPGTGKTALIAAAAVGNAVAVRALVKFEGGCKMLKGWTAMMCCVCRASSSTAQNLCTYIECINALLPYEKGIVSECGWTALVYASAYLNLACIEVLAPFEAAMSGETALSFLGALVADNEMSKSEWQYSMIQARSLIVEYLRLQSATNCPSTKQQKLPVGELPVDHDMEKYINNKSGLFDEEHDISILEGKYFRWDGPDNSLIIGESTHKGARASSGLYPYRHNSVKKEHPSDMSVFIDNDSFTRGQKSFQCQTPVNILERETQYRYTLNSKPLSPLIIASPSTSAPPSILPSLYSRKNRD